MTGYQGDTCMILESKNWSDPWVPCRCTKRCVAWSSGFKDNSVCLFYFVRLFFQESHTRHKPEGLNKGNLKAWNLNWIALLRTPVFKEVHNPFLQPSEVCAYRGSFLRLNTYLEMDRLRLTWVKKFLSKKITAQMGRLFEEQQRGGVCEWNVHSQDSVNVNGNCLYIEKNEWLSLMKWNYLWKPASLSVEQLWGRQGTLVPLMEERDTKQYTFRDSNFHEDITTAFSCVALSIITGTTR